MSTKNPLTPAGIEPTTFRFVAQHLNHCATAVPHSKVIRNINMLCQRITEFYRVIKAAHKVATELQYRKHQCYVWYSCIKQWWSLRYEGVQFMTSLKATVTSGLIIQFPHIHFAADQVTICIHMWLRRYIMHGQYPVFALFLTQYLAPESPFYQISPFLIRRISPFNCCYHIGSTSVRDKKIILSSVCTYYWQIIPAYRGEPH